MIVGFESAKHGAHCYVDVVSAISVVTRCLGGYHVTSRCFIEFHRTS